MEGSAGARRRHAIPEVRVHYLAEGIESVGTLANVSRGGLFVRAEAAPRPGSVVVLRFHTPDGGWVEVRGEVRWTTEGLATTPVETPGEGFGVRFQEPSPAYSAFYDWVLEKAGERDGAAGIDL